MGRWGEAALALLLLQAVPVLAQDAPKTPNFTVYSYPPGATIRELGEHKGVAGRPFYLSRGNHTLELVLDDDHQTTTISPTGDDIKRGYYPKWGSEPLKAKSWGVALRDLLRYRSWILLLAGAALFLTLKLWKRMRRQSKEIASLSTAAANLDTQRSLIMEQIAGHRVVELLGQGGMSEVYTAVPLSTLDMKSAVAIKVMNKELREREDSMTRFEREIQVSQKLAHPGIVDVKGSGWHGDRLYLIMELIEGRELKDMVKELKGHWKRIADILSQLFLAVDYAHHQGVFHRDLKPENIMITPEGKVKVMDFGLARAIDSKTLTQAGTAMGTPMYIAPESVSGTHDADDRSDQYTLGVIAYELLVGHVPFQSEEVFALLYMHATQPPPPPSKQADLPTAIDDVLLKMLSKKPRERYRDVEEARVALLQAMQGLA